MHKLVYVWAVSAADAVRILEESNEYGGVYEDIKQADVAPHGAALKLFQLSITVEQIGE